MKVPDDILLKFPAVFRDRLRTGEVEWKEGVCFEYEPILAYRCIKRSVSDNSLVTRNDFKSNAELGRTAFKSGIEHPESMPEYYGVSFYQQKQELDLRLRLPMKNRKVICGYLHQEGGPTLKSSESSHVCWWLYEEAKVDNFKIIEE